MNKMTVPNEILLEEAADLLSKGIEVILMTKGNSMLPFIRGEKDSVCLKKFDTVMVGDIVLVRLWGPRYVLHRVVSVSGESMVLMGDGNLKGREVCTTANLLGTVTEIIRPDGRKVKSSRGRLWAKLRPIRRYLLWILKKLDK